MVSVCVPGPAFSFLLYENAKSEFQQEGFLLGEVVHKEAITITDSDQQHVKISKIIKMNSVMACPHVHYFYNGIGKVDENRLREFLGDLMDKVVGWYRFERDPDFKLMLREKIIHKQLATFFNRIPSDLFIYCMLMSDSTHNGSTHAFSQTFLRRTNCNYENVPLHIPNLSEPNNCYVAPEPASDIFNKILREQNIEIDGSHNAIVIGKIMNALHEHTNSVIDQVVNAEKYIHELEEEIRLLDMKKRMKIEQNENSIVSQEIEHDRGDSNLEIVDELNDSCHLREKEKPDRELTDTSRNDEGENQEIIADANEEEDNQSIRNEESLAQSKDSSSETRQKSTNIRGRGRGKQKPLCSSPSRKTRIYPKSGDGKY